MKKIVFSALVAAVALASVPAFADPPTLDLKASFKSNGSNGNGNANPNSMTSNGNSIGQQSSQIIQNGEYMQNDGGETWTCQATSCTGVPGSRAAQVSDYNNGNNGNGNNGNGNNGNAYGKNK
ncbi:MAG: hypothetical protein FWD68_03385 [Alphaproteobacteria bacterium]|nr:hypothetical protein [Alphaproteobacteria bacterium]